VGNEPNDGAFISVIFKREQGEKGITSIVPHRKTVSSKNGVAEDYKVPAPSLLVAKVWHREIGLPPLGSAFAGMTHFTTLCTPVGQQSPGLFIGISCLGTTRFLPALYLFWLKSADLSKNQANLPNGWVLRSSKVDVK